MNFLLVIYSCRKYIFMKDYYVDKYKNMGYDVIFVFADPNLENDVDYVYDKENNMVVLKCEDDFEHLPNKTYFLTKIILNSSRLKNYDYIIKMDDDTEFNINYNTLIGMDVFKENTHYTGPLLLTSNPTEHDYHFGKCTNNMELNITPYELKEKLSWGSGFFYILSRHAITIINGCITNNNSILQDFLYEDMMIGKIMSENDIKYETLFSNNVITDLKRPRTSSLNKIFIEQQAVASNYTKISYMTKSMSRIKKVTVNFNKTENINNQDDNLSDNIKKEINTNRELDKKIKELSYKLNNTNNNNITNNNNNLNNINNNANNINNTNAKTINSKTNNTSSNISIIKKASTPIIIKSSKKNNSRIMIKKL